MENLETATTTESNNQGNSAPATGTVVEQVAQEQTTAPQKTETAGTTTETAEKPEFSDPNMQKRFTEKMQEISAQKTDYETKIKSYESKVSAFDRLEKDPAVVKLIKDYYESKRQPAKAADLSDTDFLEITTNPKKFQEYLTKQATELAQRMLEERLGPVTQDVNTFKEEMATQKLSQDIDNFANSKDGQGKSLYPDFYKLSDQITPYLEKFQPIKELSNEQKLEMAYKLVKFPDQKKEVVAQAHKLIDSKKTATGDRGGMGGNVTRNKKPASLEDAIAEAASQITNW
jgi:hypothetical protein